MRPQEYDAWYHTPRGRWIGDTEWALLKSALEPEIGDTILDVGCGTGWFTRRAAADGAVLTGLDVDESALSFAQQHRPANVQFVLGDARQLPFGDRSFDRVMSVTALCFIEDWARALAEIVRVTRRRFVVGLLNRNSLLWIRKGRRGGKGAYRGAHWHTVSEIDAAMKQSAADAVRYSFGVFLPGGGLLAKIAEQHLPKALPLGTFMVLSGEVASVADPSRDVRHSRTNGHNRQFV